MDSRYPQAGARVDGRLVRDHVPNLESIGASIPNPEILEGVREVPMSYFAAEPAVTPRTRDLAAQIAQSREINPLIVAVDAEGPYILEGAHRYDALKILGARSFPARVVLDLDDLPESSGEFYQSGRGREPIAPDAGEGRYVERGGARFVAGADGSDVLGEITPEIAAGIGRQAAPIRLPEGDTTYGERHIEKRHGAAIRNAGYHDAAEFVADVAAKFDGIYQAARGRLLLVKRNGLPRMAVVELRPADDGSNWSVTTAGLVRRRYLENRQLLWWRSGGSNPPSEGGPPFNYPGGQSSPPDIGPQDEVEQDRRGKIRIATTEARAVITLFEHADASTFIHESGHAWLENLLADAAHPLAPDGLKSDAETVREWLGAAPDGVLTTAMHERFARAAEQYLMEGRAPTPALARVFAQFRQWLLHLYQTAKRLGSPITDEIRGVFDRLLTMAPERATAASAEAAAGEAPLRSFVPDELIVLCSSPPASGGEGKKRSRSY